MFPGGTVDEQLHLIFKVRVSSFLYLTVGEGSVAANFSLMKLVETLICLTMGTAYPLQR